MSIFALYFSALPFYSHFLLLSFSSLSFFFPFHLFPFAFLYLSVLFLIFFIFNFFPPLFCLLFLPLSSFLSLLLLSLPLFLPPSLSPFLVTTLPLELTKPYFTWITKCSVLSTIATSLITAIRYVAGYSAKLLLRVGLICAGNEASWLSNATKDVHMYDPHP